MGFNEFISKLFGNKASRDMREIQPWVEKVKAVYPTIAALSNDELRAATQALKEKIQNTVTAERAKIAELKAGIEDTELEKRESVFNQIDKLEKEVLEKLDKALDEALPEAFAIVKDSARRFAENEEVVVTATDADRNFAAKFDFVTIDGDKAIYRNHWQAGGNDTVWNMVHYDVQLFGGVVLHKGKIAEMATGEGKTLVATLPVFLNALTGNGVHVVTVNDYLAKRDAEWMGPLYMFHGLSVDCIDKHRPNSDERRRAYLADITFGTNNEFGFDYLRDNMASSPADLVQRRHNYAIVDEVDSVLIDDARTPLIISGPVPKKSDQLFDELRPLVERLVEAQKRLDYGNINYHIPLPEGPQAQYIEFIDTIQVELTNTLNYDIYYTLDDTTWQKNNSSFLISHSSFLKSFTTFNGRNSDTIEVCYNKLSAPHPAAKGLSQNGLYRQRAYGYFPNTDSLDYVRFDVTDLVDSLVYDYNDTYFEPWIEVYQGYIKVDSTTTYLITTDLEELWVDDIRVINNNGRLKRNQTQRAQMVLEEGFHSIRAVYNNCVNDGFPAHWRKPEIRIKSLTEKEFRVLGPKDFYR